jgi:uncharacterized protein YecE (DUF72 family)
MATLRIGTSGFSYTDWVGPFYPPMLKPAQWLCYYASKFDTLELNSTYYQLPALASVMGMLRKVPDDFLFVVKGHRDLTHGRGQAKDTLAKFRETLTPFRAEHKLGGVLLQFPASFTCSGDNEDYLRWVTESLIDQSPVVVEFRHERWLTSVTMDLLRELGASFCIVDLPQVRQLPSSRIEATASIAYVRFHGRNADKWAGPATRNERYDYDYSDEELKEWVDPITNLGKYTETTYVLFNNHYRGKAAKNAGDLATHAQHATPDGAHPKGCPLVTPSTIGPP